MAEYDIDYIPNSTIQRFWSYIAKGTDDECWPWTGAKDSGGYGHIGIRRKLSKAHRLVLAIYSGGNRVGMITRHKCDNPPCCNPSHLEWGTYADNANDKASRGRSSRLPGEANPNAGLTDKQAQDIRSSSERGIDIAKRMGIDPATVSRIRSGKSYNVPLAIA